MYFVSLKSGNKGLDTQCNIILSVVQKWWASHSNLLSRNYHKWFSFVNNNPTQKLVSFIFGCGQLGWKWIAIFSSSF